MLPLLKAELRKLLTVRSTYVLCIVALLFAGFLAFWALGYKGTPANTTIAKEAIMNTAAISGLFLAVIAILLVTHEYRYNTIIYTITSSNSRNKILLAKVLAMCLFTLAFTIGAALLAVALAFIGTSFRVTELPAQQFVFWETTWRTLFHVLGFMMVGLLFGFLFRHVVGAMAVLMFVPATVEGLLTFILKENGKYLPFSALEQVQSGSSLTPTQAAFVFSLYLIAGWLIVWILFQRRDAN